MKCKDCGKEKSCPGLHTGPHKNCFRQKTNADRIREMTDAELELFLPNWSYTNACKAGERDYWLPTRTNAIRPLYQLLALAQMRPDGVWEGD